LGTSAAWNSGSRLANFARHSSTTEALSVAQHLGFASHVSCGPFSPISYNRSIAGCALRLRRLTADCFSNSPFRKKSCPFGNF